MNRKQSPEGRHLDGYVRVSDVAGREGDSFISVDVQEERIRAWATANGHEIIEMHRELDVSGGTMDRPKLNEVMARIDSGETEGLVVFNISRFARTLVGSIELVHRINERGALFASVSDGLDITTVTGRMVLGILLSIAQAERERLAESWHAAKTHAVNRKVHISASAPFGYRRGGEINPKTGRPNPAPLEVDPETAWIVPELYRRRVAGESWEQLRQWLVDNDAPTVRGADWSSSTILTMIRNRVYLGEARGAGGDHVTKDAHEALVDPALWQAAQVRGRRFTLNDSGGLLRGLVRCGSCRYAMQQRKPTAELGAIQYACSGRAGCPLGAVIVARGRNGAVGVDDVVVDLVREWEQQREEAIEFDGYDATLDLEADEADLRRLLETREQDRLDEELRAVLGRQEWLKQLADLTARIDGKQAEIEEKQRQLGGPSGRTTAEFWEKWESGEMSLAEKRTHLASVLQAVFVNPVGTSKGVGRTKNPDLRRGYLRNRLDPVWMNDPRGRLTDIPRQGYGGYRVKPWPFPMRPNPDVLGVVPLEPEAEDAGEAVG